MAFVVLLTSVSAVALPLYSPSLLSWFSPSVAATIFGGSVGSQVCERLGGKWGSARNECFTRACYAAGDCGFWLHPNLRCHRLRTGDSIGEVYFWLGNPNIIEGHTFTWLDGKPDSVALTAIIENGILTSVNCLRSPRFALRATRGAVAP
ncbi:hypothetical protein [Bradyrhizobium sp. HKCCYLS20291]|uniref:hypothetical protein n=1 Tax=Bradyrhizobium sp. HKCCYLS20291 TaxID=3420766 RepID=UPI003EBAB488